MTALSPHEAQIADQHDPRLGDSLFQTMMDRYNAAIRLVRVQDIEATLIAADQHSAVLFKAFGRTEKEFDVSTERYDNVTKKVKELARAKG